MNIREALREAIGRLESDGVPSHALAAELLLMHALGRDRTWIYSHPEEEIPRDPLENFRALIGKRATGTPTQYLTGHQEFWGLDFEVTPAVLIPRPETEHVIEVALERLGSRGKNAPLKIADIGTGSGCIAIALAHEFPLAEIFATDVSAAALEVARRNAARHNVAARIQFIESNLFEALCSEETFSSQRDEPWRDLDLPHKDAGWQPFGFAQDEPALRKQRPQFDAIVSNPPYIPLREATQLQIEVRGHEPQIALFAGENGFAIYAPLVRDAAKYLSPGGMLILELGHDSLLGVQQRIAESGAWTNVKVVRDLAGIARVISARRF